MPQAMLTLAATDPGLTALLRAPEHPPQGSPAGCQDPREPPDRRLPPRRPTPAPCAAPKREAALRVWIASSPGDPDAPRSHARSSPCPVAGRTDAAVAAIAYGVYRFFTPDYLEDFEDDFDDDDFDDDFFDDDDQV